MKVDIDVSSENNFIPHLLTMLFRRITNKSTKKKPIEKTKLFPVKILHK
jgi:hypothetical protein